MAFHLVFLKSRRDRPHRLPYPVEPALPYGIGIADTGAHRDRIHRTVPGASATLHAGIPVDKVRDAVMYGKHPVDAYLGAHAAADALFFVQLQGDYIFQVSQ